MILFAYKAGKCKIKKGCIKKKMFPVKSCDASNVYLKVIYRWLFFLLMPHKGHIKRYSDLNIIL